MEVTEAIILAGGLGTRLQEAVPDRPKALAEVAGRPMLSFIIDHLRLNGIEHIIFSLGYKAEMVERFLEEQYPTLHYTIVREDEPLGTGGAIRLALRSAATNNVLVVNGDTLFRIDIRSLSDFYMNKNADCVLALKPMVRYDRYGSVQMDSESRIIAFTEKKYEEKGLINGGIYLIDRSKFLNRELPLKFSFEKDYLEKFVGEGSFYGYEQDKYFIDIGIPSDFQLAGKDLAVKKFSLQDIGKDWAVFLDRDGVINKEIVGRYVLNPEEFHFLQGAPKAIADLQHYFGKILIVSNQRGIGKGLMTEGDLSDIHKKMQKAIAEEGGRIDKIYYCTDISNTCFNRKPNPGMAVQAAKDFSEISLEKSVMVGNKPSDMRFGRSAGMLTVFITTTNPDQPLPHPDIDFSFPSLEAFVKALKH